VERAITHPRRPNKVAESSHSPFVRAAPNINCALKCLRHRSLSSNDRHPKRPQELAYLVEAEVGMGIEVKQLPQLFNCSRLLNHQALAACHFSALVGDNDADCFL
jgi:hypothetical protein